MMGLSLLVAVLHRAVGSAVDQWAATAYRSIGVETLLSARPDLRGGGGGQTGQLPRGLHN